MDQIRPWLWIGKYSESRDLDLLREAGITAILHLADRVIHPEIDTLYLPVEDGEPLPAEMIERGVEFIREKHAHSETLLIACGAGISRSATYCVAALKEAENLDLKRGYIEVKRAHPVSLPHKALWDSLCSFYEEPVSWREILVTGRDIG